MLDLIDVFRTLQGRQILDWIFKIPFGIFFNYCSYFNKHIRLCAAIVLLIDFSNGFDKCSDRLFNIQKNSAAPSACTQPDFYFPVLCPEFFLQIWLHIHGAVVIFPCNSIPIHAWHKGLLYCIFHWNNSFLHNLSGRNHAVCNHDYFHRSS